MIDLTQAKRILLKHVPGAMIESYTLYKGKYVFCAPTNDPLEGRMDPYYSVDANNGYFEDYPVLLPECAGVLRFLR